MEYKCFETKTEEGECRMLTVGAPVLKLGRMALNGEGSLVAPFGSKTFESANKSKTILAVVLDAEARVAIENLEQQVQAKIKETEYYKGVQQFHSNCKDVSEGTVVQMKLTDKTKVQTWDIQKCALKKTKLTDIPPNSQVAVRLQVGHPWKFQVGNVLKLGITLTALEVLVFEDTRRKKEKKRAPTLFDDFLILTKKRTKLMEHKEKEEGELSTIA